MHEVFLLMYLFLLITKFKQILFDNKIRSGLFNGSQLAKMKKYIPNMSLL